MWTVPQTGYRPFLRGKSGESRTACAMRQCKNNALKSPHRSDAPSRDSQLPVPQSPARSREWARKGPGCPLPDLQREPVIWLASSARISPNRFSVKMTSSWEGSRTSSWRHCLHTYEAAPRRDIPPPQRKRPFSTAGNYPAHWPYRHK